MAQTGTEKKKEMNIRDVFGLNPWGKLKNV
jgi:hypothetical protein